MRVLVVGLNPSIKHGKSKSLSTLYKWLDYLNLDIVSFTNLYQNYTLGGDDDQDKSIKAISKQYDKVLALGSVVSNNLYHLDVDHYRLPHPSGRNRSLNNKEFVHEQLELCKNYLKG